MCLPLDDVAVTCWLKMQIRELEARQEELGPHQSFSQLAKSASFS